MHGCLRCRPASRATTERVVGVVIDRRELENLAELELGRRQCVIRSTRCRAPRGLMPSLVRAVWLSRAAPSPAPPPRRGGELAELAHTFIGHDAVRSDRREKPGVACRDALRSELVARVCRQPRDRRRPVARARERAGKRVAPDAERSELDDELRDRGRGRHGCSLIAHERSELGAGSGCAPAGVAHRRTPESPHALRPGEHEERRDDDDERSDPDPVDTALRSTPAAESECPCASACGRSPTSRGTAPFRAPGSRRRSPRHSCTWRTTCRAPASGRTGASHTRRTTPRPTRAHRDL